LLERRTGLDRGIGLVALRQHTTALILQKNIVRAKKDGGVNHFLTVTALL
jgi:hypothetical protein